MARSRRAEGRGRARVALVAAAVVALAVIVPTGHPAGGQAAPPVVTTASLDGSVAQGSSCTDAIPPPIANDGLLKVERAGDTTAALDVHVSYSGSLASSLAGSLPAVVTIAAGETQTIWTFTSFTPGTLTVTVDPDPAYTVGSPGSTTATVADTSLQAKCLSNEQTIVVGQTPADIPVDQIEPLIFDTEFHIDGYPPGEDVEVVPGLRFDAHGNWHGKATVVGDYRFLALWCLGQICALGEDITIHVRPLDEPVPEPPAAPPATPRAADPGFTG